ncbi:hypothetical protein [Fodinicurvata sp. EGI_FJ10296]|uniref:hypothetical protein n=1 Tax=Fodinicurvata sp. EGI_FJ10296 TaxID=3231908 RepID=UPI003456C842
MVLALDDKWIWDFWLARDGADWHVFFLQADKALGDPDLRHWNVSVGHAVSRDLRAWTPLGTCFRPSGGPAFDDLTTWTGSVVHGGAEDGRWHLFYTGTSRADNGMKQRIGHAVSTDLHNWVRVGTEPALDIVDDNGVLHPDYEEYSPGHWHDRAMRDPWVICDPDSDGWLMYFTAREPSTAEANAGGTIGFATSPDLYDWTLQPPVYRGGMFGQMEVPQVFRWRERWYCLFCNEHAHWSRAWRDAYPGVPVTGTHYLTAPDPRGPWTVAPGPFLDGADPCRRYAGKIVATDEGLVLLGFLQTVGDEPFVGAIADPVPVVVNAEGRLSLEHSTA